MPEEEGRPLTKGEIALGLLGRVRAGGLLGQVVVADGEHGISVPSRDGPAGRGLHHIVGATDELVIFTAEPRWIAPEAARRGVTGRPRIRPVR